MIPREDPFAAWRARPGRSTLVSLLEASQGRVFAICHQVLRHRQDAEEAAQEALLEIVSGIDRVADAEHFERWSGKVAFRTALDRKRSRRRRRVREFQGAFRRRDGADPCEGLHDAIAHLPEEDRALVLERYFDRRTFEEMGRSRGLSDVAVRKRIQKAHERLKRLLGGAMVLLPGSPFTETLFGKSLAKGLMAMKLKTVANGATIVILLSIFGGGAWMVLRPPDTNAVSSGASVPARGSETRRTDVANAPTVRTPAPARKIEPSAGGKREIYPPGHWSRMLQVIDRIAVASKRIPQLKAESREALTEEEGKRLQREAKAIEDAVAADFEELKGLITQDPANALQFVTTGRGNLAWFGLVSLIKGSLDGEIESENSPAGPLMTGLIGLASGDGEDKRMFLELARSLVRANRALGETSLRLLIDGDPWVRCEAASTLAYHARRGNLTNYLLENSTALRRAAIANVDLLDFNVRAQILTALAAIGTPENDDFVLQRFEALDSKSDARTGMFDALRHVAPRIAERQEARIHSSLLRVLNLPFYPHCHAAVIELALYLPREQCLGVLRIAATKLSDEVSEGPVRVEMLIREVEAGRQVALRDSLEKMNQAAFAANYPATMLGSNPARALISK